jgi:hypothetical protein
VDGLRQDFVIPDRPAGIGSLRVNLGLNGARAETTGYGAKLALEGSGRELAYSRLRATDAAGQDLKARLEVVSSSQLALTVEDADATYPVRIDPTFSDADWVSLNAGTLSAGDSVLAITADGSGNVYVGGTFTQIGTVAANRIAKWDGNAWSALGSGMNERVSALLLMGTNLYAGGRFTNAGGILAKRIAKWDGSGWSALGSGMNDWVTSLAAIGSDLYAGGWFTTAGGVDAYSVAKWDGNTWSPVGRLMVGVFALAADGPNLYAGGGFSQADGATVNCVARWNGSAWSPMGSGMEWALGHEGNPGICVLSLAVSGTNLYAGGYFYRAGGTNANSVARWDGSSWSPLGYGMAPLNLLSNSGVLPEIGQVDAMAVSGGNLYVGGSFNFTNAGDVVRLNHIAKWDGSAWSALGTGVNNRVRALAADGGGHLFVGGLFSVAGTNASPFIAQANLIAKGGEIQGICVAAGSVTLDCLGVPGVAYASQCATDVRFTENLITLLPTNAPPGGCFRCVYSISPDRIKFYRLIRQ